MEGIIGGRANRQGESTSLAGQGSGTAGPDPLRRRFRGRRGLQLAAVGTAALLAGIGVASFTSSTGSTAQSPAGASVAAPPFRDIAASGNPADANTRLHAPNLTGAMAQEQAALDAARKALGAPALRDVGSTSGTPTLAVTYMDSSLAGSFPSQGLPESAGGSIGFRALGNQSFADVTAKR